MKILLAGDVLDAATLVHALVHTNDHKITYCTDGARAIADLLRKRYDWAIIDGRAISGDEKDLASLILAMGSGNGRKEDAPTPPELDCPHPVAGTCGAEWSKDGILQLHCCLHTLLKAANTPRKPRPIGMGEILFEYHAPCAKDRRRDA